MDFKPCVFAAAKATSGDAEKPSARPAINVPIIFRPIIRSPLVMEVLLPRVSGNRFNETVTVLQFNENFYCALVQMYVGQGKMVPGGTKEIESDEPNNQYFSLESYR